MDIWLSCHCSLIIITTIFEVILLLLGSCTQLWQLETLLLQRDNYLNNSRPLSIASVGWSQNLSSLTPKNVMRKVSGSIQCLILENWRRGWILLLWLIAMAGLFIWKFIQYRNRAAFHVVGYCLPVAKGAAETLKLNMALVLVPVCRNTLTWLRSTRARSFVPFDDNINFHKVIGVPNWVGCFLIKRNDTHLGTPKSYSNVTLYIYFIPAHLACFK